MFFIIGLLRKTALFALISLPLSIVGLGASFEEILKASRNPDSLQDYFCFFMCSAIIVYPIIVGLHIVLCKLLKSRRTVGEIYLSALRRDIVAPFQYVGVFLAVFFRKHIIRDDSSLHNFEDFAQVTVGFIWTVLMVSIIVAGCLSIKAL